MSVVIASYNVLHENDLNRDSPRPGLVYVTTKTSDVTAPIRAPPSDACALQPDADPTKRESVQGSSESQASRETEGQEPQCEIVVHTAQVEEPRTKYATDYFTLALFVAMCCCLPFGVVGLIRNHESRLKAVEGDYQYAVKDSRTAFRYSMSGCFIGTVCYVGFAIYAMTILVLSMLGKVD